MNRAFWWTVGLLAACDAPDDWTDPRIGAALDYRIDRVRVVAVRVDPPVLVGGDEAAVDALVLAPDPIDGVHVSGCGLRTDVAVRVGSADCFAVPDLVFDIGDALPAPWTVPNLATQPAFADCPDGGVDTASLFPINACQTSFPVLVAAASGPIEGHGLGTVRVEVGRVGTAFRSLTEQDLALTGPEAVSTGERASFEIRWAPDPDWDDLGSSSDSQVRWFVDDGVLARTGRTGLTRGSDGVWRSSNELVVDDPGPIRVAAVLQVAGPDPSFEHTSVVDVAWRVVTTEVSP